LSEDENSASNSEDGDDSKVSYQSMEDDYLQQLPEFEFSDSEDDSKHSSNESVQSIRPSNTHHQLSAADKGLKNKPINIVPKAIHQSAVAILNNDTIAKDLFKPCCSNKCLQKISPSHDCCNYEPCLQFMRERRVNLLGKSVSEQISLLKTYIYNSMQYRKPQVSSSKSYYSSSGDNSNGRMNFDYVVEGHVFCGKGFCHLFGITYYLQKRLVKEIKDGRIGVSYSDMDGKKLSTIDTEAAASIVKLLQDHKILISNSMKANLTLPDTDEIGYVSILLSFYLY
jgi:hypothetical protein